MKFVPFIQHADIADTRTFLSSLVETTPAGQTVGEMRERLELLKKIKAAPGEGATLENAEHATLVRILNTRNDFGICKEGIIAVVDAVIAAKAPAAVEKTPEADKPAAAE
jgi:hypothetical protein